MELWQLDRSKDFYTTRNIYFSFTFFTFFSIDKDYPVGSFTTIQSSSRRTCKYVDTFDIIRVDIGDTFTTSWFTEVTSASITLFVEQRHPINHIEYTIVTIQRFKTTHYYFSRTTYPRRAALDIYPSYFTIKAVHHVYVFHLSQFFRLHLLYVVTQSLFLAFDTQSGYHYPTEL